MKQSLVLLLFLILILPMTSQAQAFTSEAHPAESEVGVHIFSNYGEEYVQFSSTVSTQSVNSALQSVDWIKGFHQVVVVATPGVSMEVGGSLDPEIGLSGVYRNREENVRAVTRYAPESIDDMREILLAFIKPGDSWKQVQEFEFFGPR